MYSFKLSNKDCASQNVLFILLFLLGIKPSHSNAEFIIPNRCIIHAHINNSIFRYLCICLIYCPITETITKGQNTLKLYFKLDHLRTSNRCVDSVIIISPRIIILHFPHELDDIDSCGRNLNHLSRPLSWLFQHTPSASEGFINIIQVFLLQQLWYSGFAAA